MAAMEHERWLAERVRRGWRKGQTKDVVHKVSLNLVTLDEMTPEVRESIQSYNRASVRALPRVLAGVGLQISRAGSVAPGP